MAYGSQGFQKSKPRSQTLLANLKLTSRVTLEATNPRKPWLQEPDCLTCHVDFTKPSSHPNAFNVWNDELSQLHRPRTGEGGIRCEACHSATHALYPALNPYSKNRDNIQPIQYSGLPLPIGSNLTCEICHTVSMEDAIHHDSMEHRFRNMNLLGGLYRQRHTNSFKSVQK